MNIRESWWEKYKSYILYAVLLIIPIFVMDSYFSSGKISYAQNTDGLGQHYAALQYIREYQHKIVNGIANGTLFQIPHFCYTLGQGADPLTTLNAYDFLDPICWIFVALFPYRLTRSYKLMIWIKVFLSGEAFCLYSNYIRKTDGWRTAMGGLLYSFFNIEYFFYFPNFMHGCYLFPVILWSIEVLMKENRKAPLAAVTFYSFLTNYYFFYSNVILSMVYLCIRLRCKKSTVSENIQICKNVCAAYLVGGLLSGVVLFPTVHAFLNNYRIGLTTGYIESPFLYPMNFYKQLFVHLGKFHGMFAYLTVIDGIPLGLICLFLLIMQKGNQWKIMKIATVSSLLIMCIPLCGRVLNGFAYAANRWSYPFALAVAMVYVGLVDKLCKLEKKQLIVLTMMVVVYTCIAHSIDGNSSDGYSYDVLLILTVLVLWAVNTVPLFKAHGNLILGEVTILSVIVGICVICSPAYGNYIKEFMSVDDLNAYYTTPSISKVRGSANQKEFYRVEKRETNLNIECANQVRGTTFWWSIMDKNFQRYCTDLQLNTLAANCELHGLDGRRALLDLAAVKYYTTNSPDNEGVPVGYKKIEDGLYENTHYLGSAFLYKNSILRKDALKMNPLNRQEAMLQGVVTDAKIHNIKTIKPKKRMTALPYKVETKDVDLTKTRISVKNEKGSITLHFEKPMKGELYLWMNGLKIKEADKSMCSLIWGTGSHIFCCGQKKGDFRVSNCEKHSAIMSSYFFWYAPKDGVTYYLGKSDEGYDSVKIVFANPAEYTYKSIGVYENDTAKYMEDISKLTSCRNISIGNDTVSGSVECSENEVLFLSIPYSTGWSAKVDGEKTSIVKANGMYMAIPLTPGKHHIQLKYSTPWLRAGILTSLMTISGILIYQVIRIKRRSKSAEHETQIRL